MFKATLELDLTPLYAALGYVDAVTQKNVVADIATKVRDQWIQGAQQKLRTTRQQYISAIGDPEVAADGSSFLIRLQGNDSDLPVWVEEGRGGFSIRDEMMKDVSKLKSYDRLVRSGPNSLKKEKVLYRNIPFQHAGPGTKGRAGVPIGSQRGLYDPSIIGPSSLKSLDMMKKQIWREAKKLSPTVWDGEEKISQGGRLSNLGFMLKPQHSATIFQGMQRITSPKSKSAKYMTWRKMTDKQPDSMWYHPGFQPANLMEVAVGGLDEIAEEVIQGYIDMGQE